MTGGEEGPVLSAFDLQDRWQVFACPWSMQPCRN